MTTGDSGPGTFDLRRDPLTLVKFLACRRTYCIKEEVFPAMKLAMGSKHIFIPFGGLQKDAGRRASIYELDDRRRCAKCQSQSSDGPGYWAFCKIPR